MLIKGLCDYYDVLAAAGKVLPDGYSSVNVSYLIALTPSGEIDELIPYQRQVEEVKKNGKTAIKYFPRTEIMPKRTEKTAVDSNYIEHRPLYLFGMEYDSKQDRFIAGSEKDRAGKSHRAFVETNLAFIDGLHSPLIDAYRNYLLHWNPAEQTEHAALLAVKKSYQKSGYAFCLSGSPDKLLHQEPLIRGKWEERCRQNAAGADVPEAQCAIYGTEEPIARLHGKIKGIVGGQASGTALVSFNNPSEESYGNEQSYNSNISEKAANRYTEALNYLLRSGYHKIQLDEMTVIFWAMNPAETAEMLLLQLLTGEYGGADAAETEQMLMQLYRDVGTLRISGERLLAASEIDPNVDFYIAGIKPNASRLSVKFLYRKRFGDIAEHVAAFQQDLYTGGTIRIVPVWRIQKEFVSPKSSSDKGNPALNASLLEAILQGARFPVQLLDTVVRRVKTDDEKPNAVSAGLLQAYMKRNEKEDFTMGLDRQNHDQAYLCGRLFAVLERLQQNAAATQLNRTIKDSYFSSAAARPVLVMPKLIMLAQHHLNKVQNPTYFNKLMGEIMDGLDGTFPQTLSLTEQGKFIIGYYQQQQSFFRKAQPENDGEEK